MSEAYGSAVRENLPNVVLVLDHFNVVKAFQEKLTDLRRDLYSKATEDAKDVLKGSRWLLLKNPENLDPTRKEKERLEEALQLNKPLAIAYYLKEDLRSIWSQDSKENADKEISAWIEKAEASEIQQLKAFAKTLANHRKGILSYYDFRVSTGPLEGMNNKIKTMKRGKRSVSMQTCIKSTFSFFEPRETCVHQALKPASIQPQFFRPTETQGT